jgi:hypothetical protein
MWYNVSNSSTTSVIYGLTNNRMLIEKPIIYDSHFTVNI